MNKGSSKILIALSVFVFVLLIVLTGSFQINKYKKLNYEFLALAYKYDQSENQIQEFKTKIENLQDSKKFIRDPKDFIGENWADKTKGLVQFRGNPTHTFYGTGPISENLKVVWRFPENKMCGKSVVNN